MRSVDRRKIRGSKQFYPTEKQRLNPTDAFPESRDDAPTHQLNRSIVRPAATLDELHVDWEATAPGDESVRPTPDIVQAPAPQSANPVDRPVARVSLNLNPENQGVQPQQPEPVTPSVVDPFPLNDAYVMEEPGQYPEDDDTEESPSLASEQVLKMPVKTKMGPAATSTPAQSSTERVTIAPMRPESSSGVFNRAAQAFANTIKRWGMHFAVLSNLFTQSEPEGSKPAAATDVAELSPETIASIPESPQAVVPATGSEVRMPVAVDTTPPPVSVQVPDFGVMESSSMPRVDGSSDALYTNTTLDGRTYQSNEPLVPVNATLMYAAPEQPPVAPSPMPDMKPVQATAPMPVVDVQQPAVAPAPVAEMPTSSAEVSKDLNQEIRSGKLSPEKQIQYIDNLFDTLDTSKVFIRLSPTKRLELRKYPNGEIEARFPGEKDFRPLTVEDVAAFGKDLSQQPHYTR